MNWFKKRLSKNYKIGLENAIVSPYETNMLSIEHRESSLSFTVHKANGGFVVEYRIYEPSTDRHNSKLHIINEEDDLGKEIGKIIAYECLRS